MLLPEALTSIGSLKESLGLADTSKDSLLTAIINRVTLWIESQTHRKLVARNYNGTGTVFSGTGVASEDYFFIDGLKTTQTENGLGQYFLPAYPVQRGTSALTFQLAILQSRSSSTGELWDTTSLVEWDHWMLDTENGVLRLLGGPFVRGIRNYRVQCTAGFFNPVATPTAPWVPADLESLCIEFCKLMYRESRNVTSERIGTWARAYDFSIKDPLVEDALARYRRVLV